MELSLVRSIDEIARSQWDNLPKGASPFWRYDFLKALEKSTSTGENSGWQMRFLVLKEKAAQEKAAQEKAVQEEAVQEKAVQEKTVIAALLPVWQKSHGMGEYVFDHLFSESWQRFKGTSYYPKLVAAVPFTPVRLPKLFAHETVQQRALLRQAKDFCCKEGFSSLHLNFVSNDEAELAEQEGFARRWDIQCHWHNRGYGDFDDFLQTLPRSRRKMIRKECAALTRQGFRFRRLSGAALRDKESDALWDIFYRLYCATYARKWGYPYFTREFFQQIRHDFADSMLLVVCEQEGNVRSVALSFFDEHALYGRHWGASDYVPYLHFATCYYQSIVFALERGLSRVEAGTQGIDHKLPRGFEPELLASVHFFSDPVFAHAAGEWCAQERRAMEEHLVRLRSCCAQPLR